MRHRDRPRAVLIGGGGAISSPSSSSSSSSSDFEFTISLSPSSRRSQLCPADDLFYKGKLLPLHLSPRISMVRTLLLASSSTSSSSDATASRDSTASSSSSAFSDFESSRPSSVTEDDAKRSIPRRPNYFSSFATRFSSVFHPKLNNKKDPPPPNTDPNIKKSTTKEVIKKYVKKMKPFYEKLSSRDQKKTFSFSIRRDRSSSSNFAAGSSKKDEIGGQMGIYSHSQSFSGNLRYPRRKRCAGSCPSSMRSSPSHSGLLYVGGGGAGGFPDPSASSGFSSSMEELQSAIQGAIAHCKSTMIRGA